MKHKMKKLSFLLITGTVMLFTTGCAQKEATGNTPTETATTPTVQPSASQTSSAILEDVSVKKFHEMIGSVEGLQLLDVRTPQETAEGIVAGATLINVNDPDFAQQLEKLDKNKPVAVYCKAGGRSRRAQGILAGQGFKEVYNVDGGFDAWKAAGFEQAKP